MRAAKVRGEVTRFPGGRRAKGLPPLSRDPKIRAAQRIIETVMAEKEVAPAIVSKPWAEMSRGEKLAAAADKALDVTKKTLDLEIDPIDNPKLYTLQNTTALAVISNQIRVEQGPQPVQRAGA